MALSAKSKARKGVNGTGDSVTVFFDASDPAERRALEAARLLAAKHGRRKQAIIALLEAVYAYYEANGELLSSAEITAALMGKAPVQMRPAVEFPSVAVPRAHSAPSNEPGVVITGSSKASAKTVADNFLKNYASSFFD